MVKRIAILFVAFITLIGALLGADYFGLLGVKKGTYVDYFNVRFTAVDAQTQMPIEDFFVNCTKRGSRNACSIEQGMKKTQRLVKFGILKNFDKTHFFVRNEEAIGLDEMTIHLMFIHQDYQRKTLTYSLNELLAQQDQLITVTLEK